MNTVWIMEASQGTYSDRADWIMDTYASLNAALADAVNRNIKFNERKDGDKVYYTAIIPDEYDDIYVSLTEYAVRGTN